MYVLALFTLLVFAVEPALAAGESQHNAPIAPVILGVTGILFFAFIGRFSARKFS